MRELFRRLHRDERGISLVELIVAMAVTSLLLALVGSFFVSISRAQQTVQAVSGSTRQASTSMQQVSRYLREAQRLQTSKTDFAPAFAEASSTRIVFYSAVDLSSSTAGLTRVTLQITGGALRMTTLRGNCSTGYCQFSGSGTTVTLADAVRGGRSGDAALFSFQNGSDAPVTNLGVASSRDTIRLVRVHLEVGSTTGAGDNDTTFDADVNLRNLDYGTATE